MHWITIFLIAKSRHKVATFRWKARIVWCHFWSSQLSTFSKAGEMGEQFFSNGGCWYPSWNSLKMVVPIGISSSRGLFSDSMLVSGEVNCNTHSWLEEWTTIEDIFPIQYEELSSRKLLYYSYEKENGSFLSSSNSDFVRVSLVTCFQPSAPSPTISEVIIIILSLFPPSWYDLGCVIQMCQMYFRHSGISPFNTLDVWFFYGIFFWCITVQQSKSPCAQYFVVPHLHYFPLKFNSPPPWKNDGWKTYLYSSPFLGMQTCNFFQAQTLPSLKPWGIHTLHLAIQTATRGVSSTAPSVPGQRSNTRRIRGPEPTESGRRKRAADAMESHGWWGATHLGQVEFQKVFRSMNRKARKHQKGNIRKETHLITDPDPDPHPKKLHGWTPQILGFETKPGFHINSSGFNPLRFQKQRPHLGEMLLFYFVCDNIQKIYLAWRKRKHMIKPPTFGKRGENSLTQKLPISGAYC